MRTVFESEVIFYLKLNINIMKKVLILLLTICNTFVYAQEYASASILESVDKEGHSKIVIAYGSEESEIIPLNSWSPLATGEEGNKPIIENQKTINNFLKNMAEKGYRILSVTSKEKAVSATQMSQISLTFIIFEKKAVNEEEKKEGKKEDKKIKNK